MRTRGRRRAEGPPRAQLRPSPFVRRRQNAVLHVAGLVLAVGGAGMVASGIVEAIDGGPDVVTLLGSGVGLGLVGLASWRLTEAPPRLLTSAVHASVLWTWVLLSVAATVPYLLSGTFSRFDLALFESIAGFTTTGATVLRPIEGTSAGILFWRAMTQWMGGIGVVVLVVSVLPFLGVGGMGLLQAEAPGPSAERLVPRVQETAKRLVALYLVFTALIAGLYAVFGMTAYDAVTHSFTTVSTGGFNPYNRSFAHFESAALEWVAIVGMFGAGMSFPLLWQAFRRKPLVLVRSVEFKAYALIAAGVAGATVAWNVAEQGASHDVVRQTIFTTVSLGTTTGYVSPDYEQWNPAVHLLLLFTMGVGGMAGSTAGGMKTFRLLTVLSHARRQVFQHLHPRAVTVVRFGKEVIPDDVANRVVSFFALFMGLGALGTFIVAATGSDVITSIAAVVASIGNVGPGFGGVGPTTDYLNVAPVGRWVLMVAMLAGRLELFPVFLGVVPVLRSVGHRLPLRVATRLARIGSG